jgi:hypothetical protein
VLLHVLFLWSEHAYTISHVHCYLPLEVRVVVAGVAGVAGVDVVDAVDDDVVRKVTTYCFVIREKWCNHGNVVLLHYMKMTCLIESEP